MATLIETVVFPFEDLLPSLESLPISARRALDHAGARLSQEAWRSLSLEDREALAFAGGQDIVDVEHVLAVAKNADPPPARVTPSGDPDEFTPPEALVRALEPNHKLDSRRWNGMRALDRYALVHAHRRAIARGAIDQVAVALDAIMATQPLTVPPPQGRPGSVPPPPFYARSPHRAAGEPVPRADPVTGSFDVPPGRKPRSDPPRPRSDPPRPEANANGLSTHLDEQGNARMVDVGAKPETARRAVAAGSVAMRADTARKLSTGETPKGDVLAAARIAGILAAKRTPELIPLCHHVALTKISIDLSVDVPGARVDVTATAEAFDKTGVEMEALTAVSVACLTIYDMLKGVDRSMTILDIRLLEKTGGRNGPYRRTSDRP